jgi:ribonuclease-3
MSKRANEDSYSPGYKKQKNGPPYHGNDQYRKHPQPQYGHHQTHQGPSVHQVKADLEKQASTNHSAALQDLPPSTGTKADVPGYTPFTIPPSVPPLPEITSPALKDVPFKHKSMHSYDRVSTALDVSYERLEFLGDAYLELFASRLIFHHLPSLPVGSQSQVREVLVRNETLSEYARLYGFERKVQVADLQQMLESGSGGGKGNKGLNKILGDVFEAYIAALVLSDPDEGFATAEKWLTALWAPKLLAAAKDHHRSAPSLAAASTADPSKTYNPTAKADLQRLIMSQNTKLEYEAYKPMLELKGDKIGQNRHFIAVYLTGYGYEKLLLGKGEGKNKVEAGNWAATEAVYGEKKGLVEECAGKLEGEKARRAREKEEKDRLREKEKEREREKEKEKEKEGVPAW